MIKVKTTHVFKKLCQQKKRLSDQLMFANKCLNVLIQFKSFVELICDKFKHNLDSNDSQKFEELSQKVEEVLTQKNDSSKKMNEENDINSKVSELSPKNFNPKNPLIESSKTYSNECVVPFNCLSCDQSFGSSNDFNDHMKRVHNILINIQKIKCNFNRDINQQNNDNNNQKTVTQSEPTLNKSVLNVGNQLQIDGKKFIVLKKLPERTASVAQSSNKMERVVTKVLNKTIIESKFVCDVTGCGKIYLSLNGLKDHKKSHSEGYLEREFRYYCQFEGCDYGTDKKIQLEGHAFTHKGIKPFVCDSCHMCFSGREDLQLHLKRTHNVMITTNELKTGLKTGFINTKQELVCKYDGCDFVTDSRSRLKRHQYKHKATKSYVCDTCGKAFYCNSQLMSHVKGVHELSDELLVCNINNCKKEFRNEYLLKNHQKVMHLTAKKWLCQYPNCGKWFVYQGALKQHAITHSTQRPFVCTHEGCDKRYKSEDQLKAHKRLCHSSGPFRCPHENCQKVYRTKGSLISHSRRGHSSNEYLCEWPGCEYRTPVKESLKIHSLSHTDIRKYVCDWPQCEKRFKSIANMRSHIKVHKGEKPHACHWPGCEYRCVTAGNLKIHMKVHQKK